jgi:hypothetical protein
MQPRKKDLTSLAFALIMARGTSSLLYFVFALARPRQKFGKVKAVPVKCE